MKKQSLSWYKNQNNFNASTKPNGFLSQIIIDLNMAEGILRKKIP